VKEAAKCEVDILNLLNPHQHIVEYIESYHTPEEVVVVLEYCAGGDLLDEVNRIGPLGEDRARQILLQCISGLRHMHLLGVSHRDIKLENLLLTNDQMVRLADFGFSSRYLPGQLLSDSRGTLCYAAPVLLLFTSSNHS
jgi:serine/threonine protein kinase